MRNFETNIFWFGTTSSILVRIIHPCSHHPSLFVKLWITYRYRWQSKALQVASERTTMEDAVPNRNILVSKFRHPHTDESWGLPFANNQKVILHISGFDFPQLYTFLIKTISEMSLPSILSKTFDSKFYAIFHLASKVCHIFQKYWKNRIISRFYSPLVSFDRVDF